MRTKTSTRMSIGIIVIAVVIVGLTAIFANGRTPEARKARRDRRLQARASLEAPADTQLPCYGEPRGEGVEPRNMSNCIGPRVPQPAQFCSFQLSLKWATLQLIHYFSKNSNFLSKFSLTR